MRKLWTTTLGMLSLLGLILVAGPSQAASETYRWTDYQTNIGSHLGTIHWDTAHHFSADMTVENAANCNGHITNVMFHLVFSDGSSMNTRFFPNPKTPCGASYTYFGEDFNQDKIIDSVFPRVCHKVDGTTTDCHTDPDGFFNPDR